MTENQRQLSENLLPMNTAELSKIQSVDKFEAYRNELHRELAKQWPFLNDIRDSTSKSTAPMNVHDSQKSQITLSENDISHRIQPKFRSKYFSSTHRMMTSEDSEIAVETSQQQPEWNLKAQEGIIMYELPDGLADGVALHDKLQRLMKTNAIHLNDRYFWTTLENQFKIIRKQSFQENMQRLRHDQQQYEQKLISQGILPYTTEEAIKRYAEQRRTQVQTNRPITNDTNCKNCLIDDIPSDHLSPNNIPLTKHEELDAFESDNVHPRFHEIFTDYQFQTKLGKHVGENLQDDLLQRQTKIKTIFPKTHQHAISQQEFDTVKTSEGLYAYSNRLTKQVSK